MNDASSVPLSLKQRLGFLYLVYLGILPAWATFAVAYTYGVPYPLLIFMVGVAAVGLYLTVTFSYAPLPTSWLGVAFVALDGPLILWLSNFGEADWLGHGVESFVVDGTAVWLAILFVTFTSSLPTDEQRLASAGIMITCVSVFIFFFWPYLSQMPAQRWWWLLAGLAENVLVSFRLLSSNEPVRDAMDGDRYLKYFLPLFFLWLIALFAGNVLWEMRVLN